MSDRLIFKITDESMKKLVKHVVGEYTDEETLEFYMHELNKMMDDDTELKLAVTNQIMMAPIVDKVLYSKIVATIEYIHDHTPIRAEKRLNLCGKLDATGKRII